MMPFDFSTVVQPDLWAAREQMLAIIDRRRFTIARLTAAIAVGSVLCGWAVAQYPYLLVGSLTIGEAASGAAILSALLSSLVVGTVLVVPSVIALFVLSQRPVHDSASRSEP